MATDTKKAQDIRIRLEQVRERLAEPAFLANDGLANEVGIHIFVYDPADEMQVRTYFEELQGETGVPFRLRECDLYRIFLNICEEKRILSAIPKMEQTRGKTYLQEKLANVATPEAFVERMAYAPHRSGDILLITGVGNVYPFMRVHKILDNIQHIFSDIPVLVLYPGRFDGQDLELFGKFLDGHYYRAFNLI